MSQNNETPNRSRNSIKILSNIEFAKDSFILNDASRNEFPTEPKLGTECLVKGMKYIYTSIDNDEPVWLPLGIQRTHNITIQKQEQLEWVVDHGLSTMDIIVGIYDNTNKVIEADYTILSVDTILVKFSQPTSGRVVVFGSTEKYAGYTPSVNNLNSETVSIGFNEPDESIGSTIYIQLEN